MKLDESRLLSVQVEFAMMVPLLQMYLPILSYRTGRHYAITYDQAYRTPDQAQANADAGNGILKSLHTMRLAIDLNLFIDGEYQTESAAHLPLGEFWESINGVWGGRFKDSLGRPKPDGNHYSRGYGGVK